MGRKTDIDPDQFAQVNVRMTKEFKEECDAIAELEGVSLNEWIRRAMKDRNECAFLKIKLEDCEREISSKNAKIAFLEASVLEQDDAIFRAKKSEQECRHLSVELNESRHIIGELQKQDHDFKQLIFENSSLKEELKRLSVLREKEREEMAQLMVKRESSAILEHYLQDLINRIIDERLNTKKTNGK